MKKMTDFIEKMTDTSEAIINMMQDCRYFKLSIKESFPMTVCRTVKIDGVTYRMETTVTM